MKNNIFKNIYSFKILYYIILMIMLFSCANNHEKEIINHINKNSGEINSQINLSINRITTINELIKWQENIKELFIQNDNIHGLIPILINQLVNETNSQFKALENFFLSDLYWEIGNQRVSMFYISEIDESDYNINYHNNFLGYNIAKRIISADVPFDYKEHMYQILIEKYEDLIDLPYTLYEMALFYKNNFEMGKAVILMQKIIELSNLNNKISEGIDLIGLKEEISYYKKKKEWIFLDLETLIKKIQLAVKLKNQRLLYQLISKTNFEIKIFQKSNTKNWSFYELGINQRWNNRITFADKIEDFSSEDNIYLKTDNWNFPQMKTWYLNFKKVNYPYDININGGWEWKGIYFGHPM